MTLNASSLDRSIGPEHPAPSRAKVSPSALWFGVLGAPAAWSVQTWVNLPVASHSCFPNLVPLATPWMPVRGPVFVVSLAAIIVGIAALAVAWRSWTRLRGERHESTPRADVHSPRTSLMETGEGRTRFMALCGVLASATFILASLAQAASLFMVGACAS